MIKLALHIWVPKRCIIAAVLITCLLLSSSTPHAEAATRYEIGISTSTTLFWMNEKALDKRLEDIKRLGATWIRVDFSWPAIQPKNAHTYQWRSHDRVVRAAGKHGLKIIGMLAYTPRWAQEPRCARLVITVAAGQKCNPKSNAAFADFARTAAIRYKRKNVRAWEIWNEPNLSSYWKTAQPANNPVRNAVHADARAYARLANAVAYQIRHAAPDTIIITGGLAPLFEPKYPKGLRQSDYLAQLLPHLNPHLFDAVGVHPYSWPTLPDQAAVHNAFHSVDRGKAEFNLQAIMQRNGFGAKQMWGTEFGAPTSGMVRSPATSHNKRPDHVTEALQAQIITRGISSWYSKSNVGPLIVHSDSDEWLKMQKKARKNESSFGLRRGDGTKKPAYDAFQRSVQELKAR